MPAVAAVKIANSDNGAFERVRHGTKATYPDEVWFGIHERQIHAIVRTLSSAETALLSR
ncbi:hypothetical protein GCM10011499_28230 [Pelagibacterium lentulum]|uniref:Uncharacterized protein n=1 Tax=Pelagibacterium lentulum TaxID=2029865 RepID=A0A916VZX3_9HYPH|nr:hypothetical protein GCM10011499_28230 [Pelagibacterium lentulum]